MKNRCYWGATHPSGAAWRLVADHCGFLDDVKVREQAEAQGDPAPAPSEPATSFTGFERRFKETIAEESVPEGYPFGVAYDELEKRLRKKVPAQLRKVRGKLNVPRERFHSVDPGQYKWAGLQFQGRSTAANPREHSVSANMNSQGACARR